jgi:hypothetical protein
MKRLFVSLVVFTLVLNVKAQESYLSGKKYYIEISYGKSFPVGDFGNKNGIVNNSGYSKMGNKFDLLGEFEMKDNIRIIVGERYQNFPTDEEV